MMTVAKGVKIPEEPRPTGKRALQFNYCPACGTKASIVKQNDSNYECSVCRWHFWNNAKAAVGVAFVKDGHVMVSQRGIEPFKGMYDLPGGFVDFNESAQHAAIREMAEELGVQLRPEQIELVNTYTHYYMEDVTTVDVIFVVRDWDGQPAAHDDVAKLEWQPFSFLDEQRFRPTYQGLSKLLTKLTQ
jgi:NAD+ diphosphatase